jgi:hypothetical protein
VQVAVALAPNLAGAQTPTNPPALVSGSDITLYEATENMRFLGRSLMSGWQGKFRKATSELFGVARLGSPLCPVATGHDCSVNATGSSDINMTTGQGNIVGTVTVVAQGDNPFDSPELVVQKGKFVGKIDFSSAATRAFGTVSALLVVDGGGVFGFTGTFRQPVGDPAVYSTPTGFPCPFGTCTFVQANEFALGFPTVRFEIKFDDLVSQ